jgi:hypothetical protein
VNGLSESGAYSVNVFSPGIHHDSVVWDAMASEWVEDTVTL